MKKQKIVPTILIFFGFISMGCMTKKNQVKSQPIVNQEFKMPIEIVRFTRGACFGKCPEFQLWIFNDGKVILHGKNNLDHIGKFSYMLTEKEKMDLETYLNQIDFESMKDRYYGEIADVPSIGLTVNTKDKQKTIGGNWKFPEELREVFKYLDNFVYTERWMPLEENPVLYLENKSIIPDKIIVNLIAGIEGEEWVKKFEQYDCQVMKKVAPRMQLWVITYAMNKIHPMEFLKKIKSDPDVIQAEFDKKLTTRQ